MTSTHPSDTLSSIDPALYDDPVPRPQPTPRFYPANRSKPPSKPIIRAQPLPNSSQDDPFDLDPPSSPNTSPPTSPLNIEGPDAPKNQSALAARRRWAWVWKHMPDEDPQTVYLTKNGKVEWRCNYCKIKYLETGGTRID